MEYLTETGISFNKGEQLTARKLQILNDKINELVKTVNGMLMGLCDINVEINDFTRVFDLSEAIDIVSQTRRMKGMKVRFLGDNNSYLEYSYVGPTVNDTDWENVDNWTMLEDPLIDGGKF
jgi:hypothetical protein